MGRGKQKTPAEWSMLTMYVLMAETQIREFSARSADRKEYETWVAFLERVPALAGPPAWNAHEPGDDRKDRAGRGA
jgi:hypothetical protein